MRIEDLTDEELDLAMKTHRIKAALENFTLSTDVEMGLNDEDPEDRRGLPGLIAALDEEEGEDE